jgi:hypothetical protein
MIILLSSIIYADNNSNFDVKVYENLYKEEKYEDVILQLTKYFKSNNEWDRSKLSEQDYIQSLVLLADSYRILKKYNEAKHWYAIASEGYFDLYATYCYEVIRQVTLNLRINDPTINFDNIDYNSEREEILLRVLEKLIDKTSLIKKEQYFKGLISYKNDDWFNNLIKYCAGEIPLNKLLLSVPKENLGVAYTYAGLKLEVAGDKIKSRELYKKVIHQQHSTNIELLMAANRLGIFSLQMLFKSNDKTEAPLAVFSVGASSAKLEKSQLYSIYNLMDEKNETAWVPESNKGGIGEWVEVSFDNPVLINSISLTNGYAKNEVSFINNNRIKTITIDYFDGYKRKIILNDTMKSQTIPINKTIQKFKLTIEEIYKGIKFNDTCLSEMKINFDIPVGFN